MQTTNSICELVTHAAAACPRWIYAVMYLCILGRVRKSQKISGFWLKLFLSACYCLLGSGLLIFAGPVVHWALPPSTRAKLIDQFFTFVKGEISRAFQLHYWWSVLGAFVVVPFAFTVALYGLALTVNLIFVRPAPPIQVPEPSGAHGTARVATDDEIAAAGLTSGKWGEGIRLGSDGSGKPIRYRGGNSVCIIGPSGEGKFTDFIAFQMAEAGDKSMLVLDPACQITPVAIAEARRRGRVVVIAPYQEELPAAVKTLLSPMDSFNVMASLDPRSESFTKQCDAYAEILVPAETSGESKDAGHFTNGAQTLTSAVMMGVKLYLPAERANLAEVCNIICTGQQVFDFARAMEQSGDPHIRNRLSILNAPKATESRSVADILQTARLKLKFISDPAMHRVLQTSNWKWDDLKDDPTTVFACVAETLVPHSKPFFELFLNSAIERLLATPKGKHQVVIVADEFPLFKSKSWELLFSTGRKHGVSGFVCAQNHGQIEDNFGRLGAESLLSACAAQVYLAPREPITADRISKLTGKRTIVTPNISFNQRATGGVWQQGINFPEHGGPVFDPHEAMTLGRNRFFMFAPGLVSNVIIGTRKPYWEEPEVLRRCGADPYHANSAKTAAHHQPLSARGNKSFFRRLWEL